MPPLKDKEEYTSYVIDSLFNINNRLEKKRQ